MKKASIWILVWCIVSCSTRNSDWYTVVPLTPPQKLSGKKITIQDFRNPVSIEVLDTLLLVLDTKSDYHAFLLNTSDHRPVSTFGYRGKGPGELLSARTVQNLDSHIWLNDLTLSKSVGFDLKTLLKSKDSLQPVKYKEHLRTGNLRGVYEYAVINDTLNIGISLNESSFRLAFFNHTNILMGERGTPPPKPGKGIPNTIHNQSFQAEMALKPDRSKIVVVSRYSDLVEIFDTQGNDLHKIKTELDYLPEYKVLNIDGNAMFGQDDAMRFGYIDVAVTNTHIYALFSGRTRSEYPGRANAGNIIHMYTWDGELTGVYELESDFISIALMEKTKKLYALEYGLGQTIYTYQF